MKFNVDGFASHRVKYKKAGAAMRAVIRRANAERPHLGSLEHRVLSAVLDRTATFSKLCDSTTARELACIAYGVDEVDGRDRERVRHALNRLAARNIGVSITPCGKGRSARVVVSIEEAIPLTAGDVWDDDWIETPLAGGRNTRRDRNTPRQRGTPRSRERPRAELRKQRRSESRDKSAQRSNLAAPDLSGVPVVSTRV